MVHGDTFRIESLALAVFFLLQDRDASVLSNTMDQKLESVDRGAVFSADRGCCGTPMFPRRYKEHECCSEDCQAGFLLEAIPPEDWGWARSPGIFLAALYSTHVTLSAVPLVPVGMTTH